MRGTLDTIVGPMYAGKTSAIMQRILWIDHQQLSVLVIKPAKDDRYGQDEIVTHNKLSYPCYNMHTWDAAREYMGDAHWDTVFIDEVQFLPLADTIKFVQDCQNNGTNVVAAGLNQDSNGDPFETTAMLMAISDNIQTLTAICSACGGIATKTHRTNNESNNRIAVGSIGMYEPRCTVHWKQS